MDPAKKLTRPISALKTAALLKYLRAWKLNPKRPSMQMDILSVRISLTCTPISDFTLLVHPEAESKIRQGVTTELVGNCCGSPAPVPDEHFDDFMRYMIGLDGFYQKVLAPEDWKWKTLAQFYQDMTQPPYGWDNPIDGLGWDQIRLNGFNRETNQELEGLTVARIAEHMAIPPLEAVFRLFEVEQGGLSMIVFSMNEEEVIKIMQQPEGMFGSDGCAVAPYGLTATGKVHPRFYGTYPRILGRYVREKKVLTLEQAIYKMTGLPARKLQLKDRGLINKGYQADIVVFDENQITDTATFENPHQYPKGIHHVLVNGRQVISNGEHTGRLPGKVLKRNRA